MLTTKKKKKTINNFEIELNLRSTIVIFTFVQQNFLNCSSFIELLNCPVSSSIHYIECSESLSTIVLFRLSNNPTVIMSQ